MHTMYTAYLFFYSSMWSMVTPEFVWGVHAAMRTRMGEGGVFPRRQWRMKHDEINLFEYTRQWGGEEGKTEEQGRRSQKKRKANRPKRANTTRVIQTRACLPFFAFYRNPNSGENGRPTHAPHPKTLPKRGRAGGCACFGRRGCLSYLSLALTTSL